MQAFLHKHKLCTYDVTFENSQINIILILDAKHKIEREIDSSKKSVWMGQSKIPRFHAKNNPSKISPYNLVMSGKA